MKYKKTALCFLCVFLLTSQLFFPPTFSVDKVDTLKMKIAELSKQKSDIQKKIDSVKKEKASQLEKKSAIDQKIRILSDEISSVEEVIDAYTERIAEQEAALHIENTLLDKMLGILKKRVRTMHEDGQISYLAAMLQSDSTYDLITRSEMISQIVEYDRTIIYDIQKKITRISDIKAGLEQDRQEQALYVKQLQATKADLDGQLRESERLWTDLEKTEAELLQAYNESQREEDKLNDQLKKEIASSGFGTVYIGGEFVTPLPGYTRISCYYGPRTHPVTGQANSFHRGIDIPAPKGTKIRASNGGTILKAEFNVAYGNYIVINHGGNKATLYGHMTHFNVKKGDTVAQGDVIGFVGSTGYSTGPHLHFEILIDGKNVNPIDYFTLQ